MVLRIALAALDLRERARAADRSDADIAARWLDEVVATRSAVIWATRRDALTRSAMQNLAGDVLLTDQYQLTITDTFEVADGQHVNVGDVRVKSHPVRINLACVLAIVRSSI